MHILEPIDNQNPSVKRATWFKIIEDYKASGQTQLNFCKQRGINKNQFTYYLVKWRKFNIKATEPMSFLPVEVFKQKTSSKCLLNFAPDLSLEFPEGISLQSLSELILNLRSTLC